MVVESVDCQTGRHSVGSKRTTGEPIDDCSETAVNDTRCDEKKIEIRALNPVMVVVGDADAET